MPLDQNLHQTVTRLASKRNMKNMKTFLQRFPVSRFLAQNLRVNTNCHEKFLKNLSFGVGFKLYVLLNTHNISGVRS